MQHNVGAVDAEIKNTIPYEWTGAARLRGPLLFGIESAAPEVDPMKLFVPVVLLLVLVQTALYAQTPSEPSGNGLIAFLPLVIISIFIAIPAYLLAKEKGRNVRLWTVLGLIPMVNFVCMWFFVGAANLRLEKKIDALLEQNQKGKVL